MAIYKVKLNKSGIEFDHDNLLPLLTHLEQLGIKHEYQCRLGFCGSCRTTINKGVIYYQYPPLAHLNKNEVLLCFCKLESDIELDL